MTVKKLKQSSPRRGQKAPKGSRTSGMGSIFDATTKDRFVDVVANAFDFLERSIIELQEGRPKYSVIDFFSAVELFLKARLLKEHWSLIVDKPESANLERFQKGDFQSVGLKNAAERLANIANDGLTKEALVCFDKLRQHRNQMVHFAHPAQWEDDEGEEQRVRIVAEQLRGWHYLKQLLIERWTTQFDDFAKRIARMDEAMRKHAEYLHTRYEVLKSQIDEAKVEGKHFVACPSCHYEAYEVAPPNAVGNGDCLVCSMAWTTFSFQCLDCQAPVYLVGDGNGACGSCERSYKHEEVGDVLDGLDLLHPCEPSDPDDVQYANCGECEGYETVVHLADGQWFCTQCFVLCKNEDIGRCEWCSGHAAFLPENSEWIGCGFCDGRAGWLRETDN